MSSTPFCTSPEALRIVDVPSCTSPNALALTSNPASQSNSRNEQWLKWIEQNELKIDRLIKSFPAIMEATEVEETSLDIDEYYDLVDTMIIALRLPEWSKILEYMKSPDTYDEKMESILAELDSRLDEEALTDMESLLAVQMYYQHLSFM